MAAGVSTSAVDSRGDITPPEQAGDGFLLIVQTKDMLTPDVIERIRDQFQGACDQSGMNCRKVVVLPRNVEVSTIKSDGTICSGEAVSPQTDDQDRPWIGDVLWTLTFSDHIHVAVEAWDIRPRGVRHAAVTLTSPHRESMVGWSCVASEAFSSAHRIAIDERTNSLSQWGSTEAFAEHREAREKRDMDAVAANPKEFLKK
jgi:hypothetical protein